MALGSASHWWEAHGFERASVAGSTRTQNVLPSSTISCRYAVGAGVLGGELRSLGGSYNWDGGVALAGLVTVTVTVATVPRLLGVASGVWRVALGVATVDEAEVALSSAVSWLSTDSVASSASGCHWWSCTVGCLNVLWSSAASITGDSSFEDDGGGVGVSLLVSGQSSEPLRIALTRPIWCSRRIRLE